MASGAGYQDASPVLLLGYDERLSGGVVNVAASLAAALPRLRLFPILGMYGKPFRSLWYTIRAFVRLPLALLTERPQTAIVVVASQGDVWRTVPFMLLLMACRRNVVLHFHKDLANILPTERGCPRLIRALWGRADRLVFLSEGLARNAREDFGLSAESMAVISNGLDEIWLRFDPEPRERRRIDVAFFGRWSAEKGVDDLAEVFSEERLGSRYTCDVFGATSVDDARSNLKFHGWSDRETVIDAVRHSSVVILPSYAEAYPMVLLEAVAVGTPFVATSIAGIPDIAKASGGGVVCAPGDVDALTRSIASLLDDSEAWERASTSGHEWAKSQTAAMMATQWARLLASIES